SSGIAIATRMTAHPVNRNQVTCNGVKPVPNRVLAKVPQPANRAEATMIRMTPLTASERVDMTGSSRATVGDVRSDPRSIGYRLGARQGFVTRLKSGFVEERVSPSRGEYVSCEAVRACA